MKRVIAFEGAAFAGLLAVVWLNEYFHFPSMIWGADKKPFEWQEALFESAFILLAAVFVIAVTRRMIRRMNQLEVILPVCSSCRNIRDNHGRWHRIEEYVKQNTNAAVSHSLCPDCARKYAAEAGISFDTQLAMHT